MVGVASATGRSPLAERDLKQAGRRTRAGPPAIRYPPAMPKNAPKRRWFQFRLRTLLVLVVLVALGCSFLAPFRPDVSCSYQGSGTHMAVWGKKASHLRVAITNNGFLPVWYPTKATQSVSYTVALSRSFSDQADLGDGRCDYEEWDVLYPGGTVELQVETTVADMRESIKRQVADNEDSSQVDEAPLWLSVFLPLRDWRGCQSRCWNEPVRIE